jgi:hypothetical protein
VLVLIVVVDFEAGEVTVDVNVDFVGEATRPVVTFEFKNAADDVSLMGLLDDESDMNRGGLVRLLGGEAERLVLGSLSA